MPLDPAKILIDATWAALEARPALMAAVGVGNRVKTSESQWLAILASRTDSASFPLLTVFGTGDATSTPSRTFGAGLPVVTFNHPVASSVTFDVRLAFDFQSDASTYPHEAEVEAALHSLFIALRASAIRPAPPTWRKVRAIQPFGGQQRTVVTWPVTVECRPYLSSLIS